LALILESDNAENLGSLFEMFETTGFTICGFSSETATGFSVSIFTFSLESLMPLPLLMPLLSFLTASTIE